MYTQAMTNYASYEEALNASQKIFPPMPKNIVIEKHRDGTASIVWLSKNPVQPNQCKYVEN